MKSRPSACVAISPGIPKRRTISIRNVRTRRVFQNIVMSSLAMRLSRGTDAFVIAVSKCNGLASAPRGDAPVY
jgi:hypothetical protein